MITKEKIIFWPLLAIAIGVFIFGFISQGKKKEALDGLLKDIELATKKSKAKKKALIKDKWDFEDVKVKEEMSAYDLLLKRSPFFKVVPEGKVKSVEPIVVEKEEPMEPLFKYKGRVMMGEKVMVVIEDQGTGKSYFAKEGDTIGDFLVSSIDDKEVVLHKKGGDEIVLSVAKKKQEEQGKEKDEETDDL
ncbi:MAG: hypothetical protein KJ706_09025 [Candidatus Omnitrophica bacterium]|nr:hypothetical protein [Candidatus Omnitrophota bacterium]MBU4590427.1 hypothetical protein [Candidatus Omnitrophota bacterium]